MQQDYLSLVFYTVLSQTASGAFIFSELFNHHNTPGGKIRSRQTRSLAIVIIILVFAAAISFFHLGNPAHALNAINNLVTSWLSREILFMCLFITSLFAYLVTKSFQMKDAAIATARIASLVFAVLFLISMMMLYMLPSVRSWYHPSTPVSFFLTSATSGLMLAHLNSAGADQAQTGRLRLLLLLFIFTSIVNSVIFYTHVKTGIDLLVLIRILLPLLAAAELIIGKFKYPSNNISLWSVIVFGLLFAGELINRIIFFLSFDRSGI